VNCLQAYYRRCTRCGASWVLRDVRLREVAEWYRSFCQNCGAECEEETK
jgi:predicted RNA-binding Zn-ribbon protein involved in translation (DUF1610 family)